MKFKRLSPNKNSILVTWIISYISILLIPIIISNIVYFESEKTLESEINRANASILRQLRLVVDRNLEDVERLCNEISWNPKLQNLAYVNENDYPYYKYDIYKLTEELSNYKNKYNNIDDFYVVLHNSGDVLVPNTWRDLGLTYEMFHDGGSMSYDQWLSLIKEKHIMHSVLVDRRDSAGKLHKSVAFLSSIPAGSQEDPVAVVVAMVDASRLLESIQNIHVVDGGQVLIINKKGDTMASSVNKELEFSLDEDIKAPLEGLAYKNVNGNKSVLSYITSKKYGWKYVTITPFKVFLKKSEYVRDLAIICTIISLFLGIGVMLYLVKKNYTPISTLVGAIAQKAGFLYTKELDEYSFINEAFTVTVDEKKRLGDMLDQQRSVMRSSFINRLLKGRFGSNIPIEESLSMYDMKFKSDRFAVILFFFEDMGSVIKKAEDNTDQNYKLVQFILTNVVEELANRNNNGYVAEVDDYMACIVNLGSSEPDGDKAELMAIANDAVLFLNEKFSMVLSVSVSGIHRNLFDISKAYEEALEAAEYKFIVGSQAIINFDELPRGEMSKYGGSYYYPIFIEQQLINTIKAGKDENAKEIIDNVFRENFENGSLTVQRAKVLVFDMVGTIIKAVSEIGESVEDSFFEKASIISRLSACQTIVQIKSEMEKVLDEVSIYVTSKRKSCKYQARERQNHELAEDVKKFIENNYTSLELNISIVSQKYDISPAYLSKIFKECNGTGMIDYINSYRIEKSKELIENSNCTINDIYGKVGFSDINSFIRTFKKYEGITPGKYKEIKGWSVVDGYDKT